MSLQGANSFEKYAKLFEGHAHSPQRYQYQLILSSGQVISGVPVAAAGSSSSDTFSVTLDSGATHEVPWNRLLTASRLP